MILSQAEIIAEKTLNELKPYCDRIEIAGSIRREKPNPNDIEIVAIPKPYQTGLFESGIAKIVNCWTMIKSKLPCKYTQRLLPEGIKLDLFFARPENWGLIFAIRTGSAEFSHNVLAKGWCAKGFKSQNGILFKNGIPIYIREEIDLFHLLEIEYCEPKYRIF